MSKREEFVLTAEQCQRLSETSTVLRNNFPKKWGEKSIPDEEQLIARDDIGALFKVLRSYSPWLQGIGTNYRLLFGEKPDWYPIDKDGKRLEGVESDDQKIDSWRLEDQTKEYKIRLGREALSGLVWCCIVRLHTYTSMPLSGRDNVEVWWSIAEAAGKSTAVRKYIGLAAAKRTEWEDDPEPKAEKLSN